MLEVAGELRSRGAEVRLSSSEEAVTFTRGRGFECNDLPLADVTYSGEGAFSLRATLRDSPRTLTRAAQQVGLEIENIEAFGADAVLSDSALATAVAARLLRVPTFTVLNQLNFTGPNGSEGTDSRVIGAGVSGVLGKLWELSDKVFLPDLPPPYTISERNLWGSGVANTEYVGFLTPTDAPGPDPLEAEMLGEKLPRVFWPVSGPPATRGSFLSAALASAAALSDRYLFVVTGGDPASDHRPRRVPGGWFYGWCDAPGRYFRACDAVVSRAGHVTIAQSILSSKPSVLVPIPGQPEQQGNAEKAARLGVSVEVRQESLGVSRLREALGDVLRGGFSERAAEIGSIARRFNAKASIADAVEAAARGRHRTAA